jgi:succinate dehydrogenase / fumarate reductase flavoprotein subunit
MPGLQATDPVERRKQAESWVDTWEENTRKWLKSTIATCGEGGEPTIWYEDVDTTLIPPRPRLYGLVGAEVIEEVFKQRQASRTAAAPRTGNGPEAHRPAPHAGKVSV